MTGKISFMVLCLSVATSASPAGGPLGDVGTFAKWGKIEIPMTGPQSAADGTPNPFAIALDVTFTGPAGQTYVVPGFFDGDGNGGSDGDVWKVRFSADQVGSWSFSSASANGQLAGYSGTFTVVSPAAGDPDFYRWGRLEYTGTAQNGIRYLKFRDGPYWLKAGCDDPENFLGDFNNYNSPQKRRDAVDFLAARGVNSLYVMTHNIGGDNQDVWPWLGANTSTAQANAGANARFDIPKMKEWLELFEYMTGRGVVPYVILEDDSAWTGYDHARYYRELIARFGHLPALLFNVGEEATENYSVSQGIQWMTVLESIDPYDHPRAVHNINLPDNAYIDANTVSFTAIQTFGGDPTDHNQQTIDWINACKTRNERVLMVNYDEPRPLLDRRGWWSAYIGGGVWEVHVASPYDRPLSTWEPAFTEIGGTRAFMESLPFWQMEPSNQLVTAGTGFVLAKPGSAYAAYLPAGGSITIGLTAGTTYEYDWWNPTNGYGGSFQSQGQVAGGPQTFTAPGPGDWALRVVRTGGAGENSMPVAQDTTITTVPGGSLDVTLPYTDFDGPGPYSFTIVDAPAQGTLTGTGQTRSYTAHADATGADSFQWRVSDGEDDSNVASVTVNFVTGNAPPTAIDQTAATDESTPVLVPLAYNEPDGPGPLSWTLVSQPTHGVVVQDNAGSNDHTYTPTAEYTGSDSFTWKMNDGLQDSGVATVSVTVRPDTTRPVLVGATAAGDPAEILVEFSEPVQQESAENSGNYTVSGGIAVLGARLLADGTTVSLTTTDHVDGTDYTLTVNGILDRAGTPNTIAPGSQASYTYVAALTISDFTVFSSRSYEVAVDDLSEGDVAYTDRDFAYSALPRYLVGAVYIRTPNDDKGTGGPDTLMTFTVNQGVTVYVMHDNQYSERPGWLQAFEDAGDDVWIAGSFSVFRKEFPAGTVSLGGNVNPADPGGFSMYTVAIVGSGVVGGSAELPQPPDGVGVR